MVGEVSLQKTMGGWCTRRNSMPRARIKNSNQSKPTNDDFMLTEVKEERLDLL